MRALSPLTGLNSLWLPNLPRFFQWKSMDNSTFLLKAAGPVHPEPRSDCRPSCLAIRSSVLDSCFPQTLRLWKLFPAASQNVVGQDRRACGFKLQFCTKIKCWLQTNPDFHTMKYAWGVGFIHYLRNRGFLCSLSGDGWREICRRDWYTVVLNYQTDCWYFQRLPGRSPWIMFPTTSYLVWNPWSVCVVFF